MEAPSTLTPRRAGTVWHVTAPLEQYAALVVVSFGGPEGPAEVMPFLRRVTAGRGVPDDRLAVVAEHYHAFGGVSPINAQNRALVAALTAELAARGVDLPVVLGNRHTAPLLADALAPFAGQRVLALITSAYRSYSSCRQYREDLAAADPSRAVRIDKIPAYAARPAFAEINARLVLETIGRAPRGSHPHVVTVAHSIPTAMDAVSGPPTAGGRMYSRELAQVTAHVTEAANAHLGGTQAPDLAFCSRSGPPGQPWLEPDVNDRLSELAQQGVDTVVLAPIGFVSDHMEVVYDLDTEAAATAKRLGMTLLRAPTVGTDPHYVAVLVDLAMERAIEGDMEPAIEGAMDRATVGGPGASPNRRCPTDCCANLRGPRPARCGEEEPT